MFRLLLVLSGAAALGLLGVNLAGNALIEPLPAHPFWTAPTPRVIAHRGGRGLWPENTLYAFEHAAALGVDVLEMDLRRTGDGEIVVLHDDSVDRTTDGQGPVGAFTLAQLKQLDAGHRFSPDSGASYPFRGQGISIPALREVLEALPQARLNLEMKPGDPGMAAPLCELIAALGAQQRVAVASIDQAAMDTFRAGCPQVATAATKDEVVSFVRLSKLYAHALHRPAAQVLQVPERIGDLGLLTAGFLHDAAEFNLKVEVWTVNEPEDMQRLLAMGVDGIMTDFPDRLLKLLGRGRAPEVSAGRHEALR
jgi:glycerophosphoryl diester phosphodiesterase